MAGWRLYDYLDGNRRNEFADWTRGLQTKQRARLNQKLRMLEKSGPDLPPQLLAGPIKHYAHIYKMKINGQVALRPLLCKGPIRNDEEFTLLKGATEVGFKWQPPNAPVIAIKRRQDVIDNPSQRRCTHVRVE
jgi:hypothetical protein